MSAEVDIKMDVPNLAGVLFDSEMEILANLGDDAVWLAADQWRGWKYAPLRKGVPYPEEQKGTSGAAWAWEMMSPNEEGKNIRGIEIINNAEIKSHSAIKLNGEPYSQNNVGQYYAGYVRRSKGSRLEVDLVIENIKEQIIPGAIKSLLETILSNAGRDRVIMDLEPNRFTDIDEWVDTSLEL
jgi:hypothetical protein